MEHKKKAVSTIIITGMYQQQSSSFQVPTKHLKRLKYYVAFFVICIIFLVTYLIQFSSKITANETVNLRLKEEVKTLKARIPIIKEDSSKVDIYIDDIRNKIKKINSYLKKRGVKTFNTGLGGNNEEASLTNEEKVKLYNDYLRSLMKDMESVPIGYPYFNSQASGYGYRSNPFTNEGSEFHSGVDFSGRTGDIVKSTASGVVISAGWQNGYGKCVRISHAKNYQTLYGHLSAIKVSVGERVAAGVVIGNIGSTGRSTGPHLHYEVRLSNKPINPAKSF